MEVGGSQVTRYPQPVRSMSLEGRRTGLVALIFSSYT